MYYTYIGVGTGAGGFNSPLLFSAKLDIAIACSRFLISVAPLPPFQFASQPTGT